MSKDFSNNLDPNKITIPSTTTLIPHIIKPFLKSIIETMKEINEKGTTIIIATHDYSIIKNFPSTTYRFKNKEIIVYTSGLGGLFKPGIPIGKIDSSLQGQINFFSDFTQLNYVKIVSYKFGGEK